MEDLGIKQNYKSSGTYLNIFQRQLKLSNNASIIMWHLRYYSKEMHVLESGKKNADMKFSDKWMELEMIIMNEVIQSKRNRLWFHSGVDLGTTSLHVCVLCRASIEYRNPEGKKCLLNITGWLYS